MNTKLISFEDLPSNWQTTPLGELVEPNRPRVKPSSKPDLPFIGMDHIEAHTMTMLGSAPSATMKSSSVHFLSGDVLYGRLRPYLNKVFQPTFEGLCSAEFIVFPQGDKLYNKYLQYFLNWSKFVVFSNSLNSGDRPRVKFEQLAPCIVPHPPYEQQKLIVVKIEELFSHIDAGIAALNKSKALLKQYRQSVLKAAVTGELTKQWREENKEKLESARVLRSRLQSERDTEYDRKTAAWEIAFAKWKSSGELGKRPARPQKYKLLDKAIDNLGPLPNGWCWNKLGNLSVDVSDGPFGSNLKSSDYVDEGVRVIRLENIGSLEFKDDKTTYITEDKYQLLKKHTVTAGDVIFSSFVAGGTRVVVLPEQITKAINKADCFCLRAFGDSVEANYLALFLATTATYKRLENQVHGATRPRINTTQLKELEVPSCSKTEQLEIIKLVNQKFESLERLSKEIDTQMLKAEKTKQSILASAFSGKLI